MENPTQLELKHLAAYLPYGLQMLFIRHNSTFELGALLKKNLVGGTNNEGFYKLHQVKPILRPLSDLNKIEPISAKKYLYLLEDVIPDFSFAITDKLKMTYWTDEYEMIEENLLDLFSALHLLCKYHFDVFGLIDAGLAVDINTLPDAKN